MREMDKLYPPKYQIKNLRAVKLFSHRLGSVAILFLLSSPSLECCCLVIW